MSTNADIELLNSEYDAALHNAAALIENLSEQYGIWRPSTDCWSVAECLDHLAVTNDVFVRAMQEPAERARSEGRWRRSPAVPGLAGRWFVRTIEPPVRAVKVKAPANARPRAGPTLYAAFEAFVSSHGRVQTFLHENADLDLAGITFVNPFVKALRFSIATGLHVVVAHERRHLWQARRIRELAEAALD